MSPRQRQQRRVAPRTSLPALVLLLALAACAKKQPYAITATDPATRRTTSSGELIGGASRYGAHAWLGIPYAKAAGRRAALARAAARAAAGPAYARRSPPGRPARSTRARSAASSDVPAGHAAGSEDCLYLNV